MAAGMLDFIYFKPVSFLFKHSLPSWRSGWVLLCKGAQTPFGRSSASEIPAPVSSCRSSVLVRRERRFVGVLLVLVLAVQTPAFLLVTDISARGHACPVGHRRLFQITSL